MPTNISRTLGKHKKRDVSVAAIHLTAAELNAADTFQLTQLPKNIVITGGNITMITQFNAATTVDVGFAGGAELLAAAVLNTAVADQVLPMVLTPVAIQTGPVLTVAVTGGTATAGEAWLVVEYIEYEQCTGELTNFVE